MSEKKNEIRLKLMLEMSRRGISMINPESMEVIPSHIMEKIISGDHEPPTTGKEKGILKSI